ncbi:hypothetical protein P3X46_006339 [Hevea brasiliensis]|uniref:TLDc domain-containing protein n=1 Tax=Hevea brasiliensis TaxID=3981 RepID=A0ABQ9MTR6_HEVBR|nr:uncharacterized protein LOC110657956 [Hevea brasiliensis]KAJ9182335.1 hypothetical protein P3X46_006339 [Hevea brasiliensis]
MYTLKEKVSNQLSRFFAESQNSSSPLPSPCSSADTSQARPFSDGGKSFSSYFHFTVPSLNFGGSRSNKHQHELKPIHSPPFRWGSKGLKQEDEHSDRYHECNTVSEDENLKNYWEDSKESIEVSVNKQTDKTLDSNDVGASGRSSSDSDVFEEAREQQTPRSPVFHLMNESSFISSELYDFLHSSLPNIVKGCQWVLLYSTLKHGISLRTLIRKSADLSGPCLLIVGDRQGAIFGGLLECPLKPTPKRKYQGTNQSFVFTTIYGEPRLFRPTGANRYYYMCLNDLLALGGGCNFALCLDGDLLNGTSGPCETFGNLCLAHQPEFVLKNVELWGFTHSSKYLS